MPYASIDEYVAAGGGLGLSTARAVDVEAVLDELDASGLRGRGGAGFPTATKWRTVASYASPTLDTSVIVNAAEGEPGTFKDRAILRANPYAVIEGALIAAYVLGSRTITIATKGRFAAELLRLRAAVEETRLAGWCKDVKIDIAEGPDEYLFGEETALLEVLNGRPPFPRVAPPWRRGAVEVVRADADHRADSGLSADAQMATVAPDSLAPPALINNVETLANIPSIIANGAQWFRSLGTQESPGTIACTITGAVAHPGVFEVALGESLRTVLSRARGDNDTHPITAVLMGVSNAVLTGADLDTPVSYEAMRQIGSGLGSASFIVIDDRTNPVALAAGVSRFLAIESCGQCTACKQDGLEIFERLRTLLGTHATQDDIAEIEHRLGNVTDGARCNLASQHQIVVGSILRRFDTAVRSRLGPDQADIEPALITELMSIDGDTVTLDETFLSKRADWTFDTTTAHADLTTEIDDPGNSPTDGDGAISGD